MATVTAKAKRRALVEQRLAASMATLADRLGIEVPPEPRPVRDPELAAIVDLERQADVLDRVTAAMPEKQTSTKAADDKPKVSRARKSKDEG